MTHADYLILPLHRREGQDLDFLPGFLAAKAPRRVSRGRKGDQLWFFISFAGQVPYSDAQIGDLLSDMARGYFQSSGSATSALLEQSERFNTFLFEHNQKQAQVDGSAVAYLSAFLLRSTRLILTQSGPVHAFHMRGDEIEHYYDPENAGRGLGLARAAKARFYDLALHPDDLFLVTHKIPQGWNESTLQNIHGQRLATLRRRFLGDAGSEFAGLLMSVREGQRGLQVLGSAQELSSVEPEAPPPATAQSEPSPAEAFVASSEIEEEISAEEWERIEAPPEEEKLALPSEEPKAPAAAADIPPMAQEPGPRTSRWQDLLAAGLAWLRRAYGRTQAALARMLPQDGEFNLPASTMAWIAALVPVAVVLLVTLLYFQVGRGELYRNYLARAQAAVAEASAIEDPLQARASWEEALSFARQAQGYDANEDVSAVLLQAQTALDDMDGIVRLDYQLALFEELDSDTEVVRMLATNTDLYLLNAANGQVIRAFLTGGGYQVDTDFQCGPGPYGGLSVGPLIDIALLPSNNPQEAALVGMDANGDLVYCAIDQRPSAIALQPPSSGWGVPSAISVDGQNLYVLDPLTNAVWLYAGEDFSFIETPVFYFGLDVPEVREALDLTVHDGDLYLLNNQGGMAFCQRTGDDANPAECEDPAEYQDGRPGRSAGEQVAGALFLQMQATEPPEPSLYLFDPVAQAVYQFSLRLKLVRQYRAAEALPEGLGTAFAVSPNRAVFLAIQNQVYIGFLP